MRARSPLVSTEGATYTKISDTPLIDAHVTTSAAGASAHSHIARVPGLTGVSPALPAEDAPGTARAAAMSITDTSPARHRPLMTAPSGVPLSRGSESAGRPAS